MYLAFISAGMLRYDSMSLRQLGVPQRHSIRHHRLSSVISYSKVISSPDSMGRITTTLNNFLMPQLGPQLLGSDFEQEKKHGFLSKPYLTDSLARTVAAQLSATEAAA